MQKVGDTIADNDVQPCAYEYKIYIYIYMCV